MKKKKGHQRSRLRVDPFNLLQQLCEQVHYPNCNSVQALTQRKLSHYAPPGKSILIP